MKIEELTETVEETTGLDDPTFAHIGRPGWQTDPCGPTALCGVRLIGVPAIWPFRLCPDCERLGGHPLDETSQPGDWDDPTFASPNVPSRNTPPEEASDEDPSDEEAE
jgi:hypothetical protein